MILFNNVSKQYRNTLKPALERVSFQVKSGEFVFIVGPSGSGKSSLLKIILKEENITDGGVYVLGENLAYVKNSNKIQHYRRNLGVVFQDFKLLPDKTVYQNVAFALEVLGRSKASIQSSVPDVLTMVGLAPKAEKYPNELSGGEQQRVAIARAVVNKPHLLLADEPTGNLDPKTSSGIMQVLERINKNGTTVMMATHDVHIVDKYKKRVIEMKNGKIVRDDNESSYTNTVDTVQV
jgi:cell division transport system ATP-binding protein